MDYQLHRDKRKTRKMRKIIIVIFFILIAIWVYLRDTQVEKDPTLNLIYKGTTSEVWRKDYPDKWCYFTQSLEGEMQRKECFTK